MHSFIKTQVLAILNESSFQGVIPATPVAPTNLVNVELNGKLLNFDVPPVMELGRVLVPLRVIFEALGAAVSWDEATQTISATKSGVTIRLQPGQKQASQNDAQIIMDVPAKIINGRTMVPVRFVSEALGADVIWDNNTRTVSIQ
ncbi:MAG: copper amine oxidase N-terminal domain-containing protein [Peptococcaceae bacterium]|nr:copper amine oxidase N-terminal domain-containing protein [Peptococcaceae bacterium]